MQTNNILRLLKNRNYRWRRLSTKSLTGSKSKVGHVLHRLCHLYKPKKWCNYSLNYSSGKEPVCKITCMKWESSQCKGVLLQHPPYYVFHFLSYASNCSRGSWITLLSVPKSTLLVTDARKISILNWWLIGEDERVEYLNARKMLSVGFSIGNPDKEW